MFLFLFVCVIKCPLVFGLSSDVTLEGKWVVTKSIDEEIDTLGLVLICASYTNSRVNLVFSLDECRKCKLSDTEWSAEYNKTTL